MNINILKYIFRNWNNAKSSFFINLIGLTTGLTCSFLIYLWVSDEYSFDKFHKKDSQLYQVMTKSQTNEGADISEATSGLLAECLQNEIPEIENVVTTYESSETNILSTANKSIRCNPIYATEDFFNIFSYDLIQGYQPEVLSDENNIVISENLAFKLFNTINNVLGQTIEMDDKKQLTVSGIFKEIPSNSSMHFDFVLPYKMIVKDNPEIHAWGQNYFKTYTVLVNGIEVSGFNKKISELFQKKTESQSSIFIRPYSQRYLYNNFKNGIQTGGRITYVRLFSIIGILILCIACINFINLSTARASKRMKDVRVKKTLGAKRKSLVFDFITETIIISLVAIVISIVIVLLFIPYFNDFTDKQISLKFSASFILFGTGALLFTSMVSGIYPAFYLTKFKPSKVLYSKADNVKSFGARRILVIFQYFISIIMIVSVFTVYKQMKFITNQDLGYKKENVIYFENQGNSQTLLSELKNMNIR